jgi:hypothetical protein
VLIRFPPLVFERNARISAYPNFNGLIDRAGCNLKLIVFTPIHRKHLVLANLYASTIGAREETE